MSGLGILTQGVTRNARLSARGLDAYPASTGDVLAATAEEAWIGNPLLSIVREGERQGQMAIARGELHANRLGPEITRSPLLTADQANERYGIAGQLSFSDDTPAAVAAELNGLKRDEIARQDVFRRAQGGFFETAARLGVGLGVSMIDPLNIASAFIPVVGPARYALWLERAGSGLARAGVRTGVGAAEGAAGAALLEPIVAGVAHREQRDYTAMDSFLNVAFGTVLGGGLHAGGGAVADAVSRLRANARERLARDAVAQLAETGRVARVDARIAGEVEDLRRAYDAVLRDPNGPALAPLVRLEPEDIEAVVVARGGWNGIGDAEVRGSGFGLVKFIWRHGERSDKAPQFQVTREDVLEFPRVIRDYAPIDYKGNDTWRVERPGPDGAPRTVVYAATRFDKGDAAAPRFAITVHVQEPDSKGVDLPLSTPRGAGGSSVEVGAGGPGSPSELSRSLRDTAAGLSQSAARSQVSPAPENIGAFPRPVDPEAEAASQAASAAGAAKAAPEAEAAIAAEELAAAEADLNRLAQEGLVDPDGPELAPLRDIAAQGEAEAKAYDAAAFCLMRRG